MESRWPLTPSVAKDDGPDGRSSPPESCDYKCVSLGSFVFIFYYILISLRMCMRVSVHLLRCVYPWRSEGQVAESVLSLHLIGPRVGTQIPLSRYPLSYLASISPFGFVCV